jgi:hypothetical protein
MGMPSTYEVERRRRIAAPPAELRERIVDLRRWTSWSPWEDLDPDLHRTYGGADRDVGAWYEWDGNRKAGRGRMEIIAADDLAVRIDLQFLRPFRSHSNTEFVLQPDGGGTLVTWRLIGENTRMSRVMGIVYPIDRMLGPDLDKGLDRLQAEAETGSAGIAQQEERSE